MPPIAAFAAIGIVGFALFGENPFSAGPQSKPDGGLGFTTRLGFTPVVLEKHWLGLVLETFPSFYQEGLLVYGLALNFEWQLL